MFIPIIFERVFVHPKWLAGFPSPTVYTNQTTISSEMSGCPDTKFANGCSLLFLASRRKGRWWYQWCLYSESFPANLQGKRSQKLSQTPLTPKKNGPTHSCNFVCLPSSLILELKTGEPWYYQDETKPQVVRLPTSTPLKKTEDSPRDWSLNYWSSWHESSDEKTSLRGSKWATKKKKKQPYFPLNTGCFNRDPYHGFMK